MDGRVDRQIDGIDGIDGWTDRTDWQNRQTGQNRQTEQIGRWTDRQTGWSRWTDGGKGWSGRTDRLDGRTHGWCRSCEHLVSISSHFCLLDLAWSCRSIPSVQVHCYTNSLNASKRNERLIYNDIWHLRSSDDRWKWLANIAEWR